VSTQNKPQTVQQQQQQPLPILLLFLLLRHELA
jgi:hypothetical protein